MCKTITIDVGINKAKRALELAGFNVSEHSDEEIFAMVIDRIRVFGGICVTTQNPQDLICHHAKSTCYPNIPEHNCKDCKDHRNHECHK